MVSGLVNESVEREGQVEMVRELDDGGLSRPGVSTGLAMLSTDVAIHGLRRDAHDARCTRGARPDRLGQFAPDVRSPKPVFRLGCRG
jgi:hypothetical protein